MSVKKSNYFINVLDHELEISTIGDLSSNSSSVILLHEGLGSVSMWKDIPEKIYEYTGFNVITYSRAGYGKSSSVRLPRPLNYMSIEANNYLPKFLDHFDLKNFYLIGHSDGGTIAALSSGEKKHVNHHGTILVAPHFFIENFNIKSIREIKNKYEKGGLKEKLSKYHDNVDNAFYGWSDTWLNPEFHKWDITKEIKKIKVPIYAIQGNADPYGSVKQVDVLEKNLSVQFRKLILDKCGHNPFFERLDESLFGIKNFINQIESLRN